MAKIDPMTADDIKIDVAFAYVVLEQTSPVPCWGILAERVLKYALTYAHEKAGGLEAEHELAAHPNELESAIGCADCGTYLAKVLAGLGWKDGE